MFCFDGPMEYTVPDEENLTEENLFKVPRGMPSVSVGSRPFDAKETVRSIKRTHAHLKEVYAKMNINLDAGIAEELVAKSAADSTELRNLGNEKYKVNRLVEATHLYTRSIANAFEGSLEQTLAFGNRSAVLLRLGKLEPCLHDVNRALQSDLCPQSSREKLEKRKVDCLSAIRNRAVNGKTIDVDATDPVNLRKDDDDAEWRALCKFDNPLIPNASAKFKIACDPEKWGRHLVATEDIEPGEILSCQKFNSLALREKKQKTLAYCSYCLSKCLALIPCPKCTESMYCSKYCRSRAYESYHRVECKLMNKANRPYKLRAMRMLIEGTEQGARIPDLMEQMKSPYEVMVEMTCLSGKPFMNDYLSILRMSQTFNTDFLGTFFTFVADFIFGMRQIGLCDDGSRRLSVMASKLTKAEVFTAMLLMNHATTARSHSFSISPAHVGDEEDDYTDEAVEDDDISIHLRDVVGIGVCALHSLINHSCDPNVGFFTRNREHVLFATRPIKKGEQLFHAYWKRFQHEPKQLRQRMLSMFFGFTCDCTACTNEWPWIYDKSMNEKIVYVNENNRMMKDAKLLRMLMPLTGGHMVPISNKAILKAIARVSKWLYRRVQHPCLAFMECEAGIVEFMRLNYGIRTKEFTREQIMKYIEVFFDKIGHIVIMFNAFSDFANY